jgi:protein involved in sex pheromone biosynthesis
MKAHILTLTLAAGIFALVACKPKADNTEKKEVNGNTDQVAEGVSEIIDVAIEEVEPIPGEAAPVEPPAEPAPE